MEDTAVDGETTAVQWAWSSPAEAPEPLVERVPYVELKLEHPTLDPTRYGESFFPDAVPYTLYGDHRVFYWRPVLDAATSDRREWSGVCATTDALSVVTETDLRVSGLLARRDGVTEVVVDGTIAGDSTTTTVESYAVPDIRVRELSKSKLELLADGSEYVVSAGTRERISLSGQTVELADGDGGSASVTPELVIRFPGERELHHPGPGAEYRLFPSFGLELDAVPTTVTVPTANGELDYEALADSLGVDASARPYPERVLWQAFAYAAFDPHADAVARLTQFSTGHLALWPNSPDHE